MRPRSYGTYSMLPTYLPTFFKYEFQRGEKITVIFSNETDALCTFLRLSDCVGISLSIFLPLPSLLLLGLIRSKHWIGGPQFCYFFKCLLNILLPFQIFDSIQSVFVWPFSLSLSLFLLLTLSFSLYLCLSFTLPTNVLYLFFLSNFVPLKPFHISFLSSFAQFHAKKIFRDDKNADSCSHRRNFVSQWSKDFKPFSSYI